MITRNTRASAPSHKRGSFKLQKQKQKALRLAHLFAREYNACAKKHPVKRRPTLCARRVDARCISFRAPNSANHKSGHGAIYFYDFSSRKTREKRRWEASMGSKVNGSRARARASTTVIYVSFAARWTSRESERTGFSRLQSMDLGQGGVTALEAAVLIICCNFWRWFPYAGFSREIGRHS